MDNKVWIGLGVLVLVVLGVFYYFGASAQASYVSAKSPVIYVYQDDCVHCQAMHPIMVDLGSQGYRVNALDAQTNTSIWTIYNVSGTPTWIAANGDRLVGEQSEADLKAWLDSHGAKIA